MKRRRARLGATAVGLGGLVFAVIQVVQGTISAFDPRPLVSLMIAGAVGLIGLAGERARHLAEQSRILTKRLRVWPLKPLALVAPLALGVFPGQADREEAVGPYVARDVDADVGHALSRRGLTLVVGPARSGKSRSLLEAARRVLATRPALIPMDGPALRAMLNDGQPVCPADVVWWLDDLERFLPHLDGADLSLLLRSDLTVLGTIRDGAWQRILRATGDDGERGRRLLAAANVIRIEGAPSTAESRAASMLYPDVDVSAGIGEALAATGARSSFEAAPLGGEQRARASRDPVLSVAVIASLGAVAALAAVVGAAGFSRAVPPSISAQVDEIRERARAAGYAPSMTLTPQRLHGSGRSSHVFILAHERAGSDELRIYDEVHGRLRLALSFEPTSGGCRGSIGLYRGGRGAGCRRAFIPPQVMRLQHTTPRIDYAVVDRPVVADVDGDGTREIIESGKNRGRLCGDVLLGRGVGEAGIPAVEVIGEVVVEDAGADLKQEVGSSGAPAHLLLFDHSFAHDIVDG